MSLGGDHGGGDFRNRGGGEDLTAGIDQLINGVVAETISAHVDQNSSSSVDINTASTLPQETRDETKAGGEERTTSEFAGGSCALKFTDKGDYLVVSLEAEDVEGKVDVSSVSLKTASDTVPGKETGHGSADLTIVARHGSADLVKNLLASPEGLHVQVSGAGGPPIYKSFLFSPQTDMLDTIDWSPMTNCEVSYPHFRCYNINDDTDLPSVIKPLENSGHVMLLILVNSMDHFDLAERFQQHIYLLSPAFPIIVVTFSTGKYINEWLSEYNRCVTARIHLTLLDPPDEQLVMETRYPGSGPNQRSLMSSTFEFTEKMSKILFLDLKEPIIISESREIFVKAMEEFVELEREGEQHVSQADILQFLELITEKMPGMFDKDYPFFICLAYHVSENKKFPWRNMIVVNFIKACIENLESLEEDKIVTTWENFFQERPVTLPVRRSTDTLYYMKLAFVFLMRTSEAVHDRHIYPTMLWISMQLVIQSKIPIDVRTRKNYWQDQFLKEGHKYKLNDEGVKSLNRGILLGRNLKLLEEYLFSKEMIRQLLLHSSHIRPFHEQSAAINGLDDYFHTETNLLDLLLKLTKCYREYVKKKHFMRLGHTEDRVIAANEGMCVLDAILTAASKRGWSVETFCNTSRSWIDVIFKLVEFQSEPEKCLLALLSDDHLAVQYHREYMIRKIVSKTEKHLHHLDIQKFVPLYCSFQFWPTELLQSFMMSYEIPRNMTICTDYWRQLFIKATERLKYASEQESLVIFLLKLSQEANQAIDYIYDLLKLQIPKLLQVRSNPDGHYLPADYRVHQIFVTGLEAFLKRKKLKDTVCFAFNTVLDHISSIQNPLQRVVLQAIYKDIVPGVYCLHDKIDGPTTTLNAIKCASSVLKHDISWTEMEPSLKQVYCLKLINHCCDQLRLRTDDMAALQLYKTAFLRVGDVFDFLLKCGRPQGQTVTSLVEKHLSHSSKVVRAYFQWIRNTHSILLHWKNQVSNGTLNFDELMMFCDHQRSVLALAIAVGGPVYSAQLVRDARMQFLEKFEGLNSLLLKNFPKKHDWCNLLTILAKYGLTPPVPLHHQLTNSFLFPDELDSVKELNFSASVKQPFSSSGRASPLVWGLHLILSSTVSLKMLINIYQALINYLGPLRRHIDFLVYFRMNNSKLVAAYISKALLATSFVTTPTSFSILLQNTEDLIARIVRGDDNLNYGEITAGESLDVKCFDIECEFNNFAKWLKLNKDDCKGAQSVKCLLKVVQFSKLARTLDSLCQRFKLKGWDDNPLKKELYDIVAIFEDQQEKHSFTLSTALEWWKSIHISLGMQPDMDMKWLELLSQLNKCADFHHFLENQHFTGMNGEVLFTQQFQLITDQLQHEDYNEQVLICLFAAFQLFLPLFDPDLTLPLFVASLMKHEISAVVSQLQTVKKNMNQIRLWFARTEDTLENVSRELGCILSSGCYHLSFLNNSFSMTLELQPTTLLSPTSTVPPEESCRYEVWNSELIDDFVHKLGFLDKKTEDQLSDILPEDPTDGRVADFLYLNKIAHSLLELLSKLKELGHRYFSEESFVYDLRFPITLQEANDQVAEVERTLTKWSEKVGELHNSNKWLLFFHVSKLMTLHQALVKKNYLKVYQHIGFLFKRATHEVEIEELQCTIEKILDDTSLLLCDKSTESELSPMEYVGNFLERLTCSVHEEFVLPSRRFQNSSGSQHVLDISPKYSQDQLIRLLLFLFNGPPEPFELLQCKSTTTEEELKLFFKRLCIHNRTCYTFLEVNNLPYELQEILLQLYLEFRHMIPKETTVHFIETSPSVLREVPWLFHRTHEEEGPSLDVTEARRICEQTLELSSINTFRVDLVYGRAGNGKTHYIRRKLRHVNHQVTISVNETFNLEAVIKKLCSLPLNEKYCVIYFSIMVLPPSTEGKQSQQLIASIGWFFFNLLILGYVEDPMSGAAFYFPSCLSWRIFIEIPAHELATGSDSTVALTQFVKEIPVFGLIGRSKCVDSEVKLDMDDNFDLQLVCKYLKAYDTGKIDMQYREGRSLVKFSLAPYVQMEECHRLLEKYMPDFMRGRSSMLRMTMFIQYMQRRCKFLDNFPAYNFNRGRGVYYPTATGGKKYSDTSKLGSTLLEAMLSEVADFCDPQSKDDWSQRPHHQLVYDLSNEGGGSIGLISLFPDQLDDGLIEKFEMVGVSIPTMEELFSRSTLDLYLSRALGVPLNSEGHLELIDKNKYVLTLDYTLKMLSIHERRECGIPVIIEGETGVGKTALIEMLSQLWNSSWLVQCDRVKSRFLDDVTSKLKGTVLNSTSTLAHSQCCDVMHQLSNGEQVTVEKMLAFGLLSQRDSKFHDELTEVIEQFLSNALFSLLEIHSEIHYTRLFRLYKRSNDPEAVAQLLFAMFQLKVKKMFHKLNIHSAITPDDVHMFLDPILKNAYDLQEVYNKSQHSSRKHIKMPVITVYMDEINTASCLGLFKEIITDRTIDGKPIPNSIFMIAACNPHRGDSLATWGESKGTEPWLKGSYYVQRLHPTLRCLMWDYGALNSHQERAYVNAKLSMMNQNELPVEEIGSLTELIIESQSKMRDYAEDQLKKVVHISVAQQCAKSTVSQRDIQRVFTFYNWFMKFYESTNPHKEDPKLFHRRAVMVSLGIVYMMRLSSEYRMKYRSYLDNVPCLDGDICFTEALQMELEWMTRKEFLPPGIAKTTALMENVLAIIICAVTHTPLIIVGDPGSSKTLSFTVVIANMKGKESQREEFRNTSIFKILDPHFYQCSRRTTSKEVETVFNRAIRRQRALEKTLPLYSVVLMDEASLPEEKMESLKALHYHLDAQEVSFVAISNHSLDAAKTNRAISLFRPSATPQDLKQLAKGCLIPTMRSKTFTTPDEENYVKCFCVAYTEVLQKEQFKNLFGLRDFIHFITYLRNKREQWLSTSVILESLERNFNGCEDFHELSCIFMEKLQTDYEDLHYRGVIEILRNSFSHQEIHNTDELHNSIQSESRYKLIIDPSEDDSLVKLLFKYGVMDRGTTRLYVCSDFPGDSQQRVSTIADIRHSVAAGHTILMCQTDEIHESFYDLFNQRFRCINVPKKGRRCYANIAIGAHSKPCLVHPRFHCVVVVKKSGLKDMPAAFLSRFEKYYLSHNSLLETTLDSLPSCFSHLLRCVRQKMQEFIDSVDCSSFYGLVSETVDSLMLTILPSGSLKYQSLSPYDTSQDDPPDIKLFFVNTLLEALRSLLELNIPISTDEQFKCDIEEVMDILLKNKDYYDFVEKMTPSDVVAAVDGGLHALCLGPASIDDTKKKEFIVYREDCFVIAVIAQWTVCYLCKRLMQLMTLEALTVKNMLIPRHYIQHYLKFQSHFGLKDIIKQQFETLQVNKWNQNVSATKLICFTRSSPLIYQLSADYPTQLATRTIMDENKDFLRDKIFSDLDRFIMCKVTSRHTRSKLKKLFEDYFGSHCCLLLLFANMKDVTVRMVNHLRIMIEEEENKMQPRNSSKLIVLCLHFPPVMFFKHCYPSLFLQGWDHHYIDTIAHGIQTIGGYKADIDVKDWLHHCCFPRVETVSNPNRQDYPLSLQQLAQVPVYKSLLCEAIPTVASSVLFKGTNKADATEATLFLEDLLFTKGVGAQLYYRFLSYWNPRVRVSLLQKVARHTYDTESTLNMTDSVQTIYRSRFLEFMVYFFKKVKEDNYLHTVTYCDNQQVFDLFRAMIAVIPLPKLALLHSFTACPRVEKGTSTENFKFPFFRQVCEDLERLIDESNKDVNKQVNSSGLSRQHSEDGSSVTLSSRHTKEAIYTNTVVTKLHSQKVRNSLHVAVEALEGDSGELWKCYVHDFACHKLHIDAPEGIVEAFLGSLDTTSVASRLVSLHIRIKVGKLNLSKVIRVLKPVLKLRRDLMGFTTDCSVELSPNRLGVFIITILFSTLDNMIQNKKSAEDLQLWYRSYSDIIHMPAVKEELLGNVNSLCEVQLVIIHITYLVMQNSYRVDYQRGCKMFQDLCLMPNLKDAIPLRMRDIMDKALSATIEGESPNSSVAEQKKLSVMSGIFSFFFSRSRPTFSEDDILFFLQMANDHCIGHFSFGIFRLFLLKVLEMRDNEITGSDVKDVHLAQPSHDPTECELVGRILSGEKNECPGPYLPTFYQLQGVTKTSQAIVENAMMQQPLAHLYFVTVLEFFNMRYKDSGVLHFIRMAKRIDAACHSDETSYHQKILLHIKKQAVLQILIHEVTLVFSMRDSRQWQDLFSTRLTHQVNVLLNDESLGGGTDSLNGHGLVIAFSLQKHLKSSVTFLEILKNPHCGLTSAINCARPLKHLCQIDIPNVGHLFPFIGQASDMGRYYEKIRKAMHDAAGGTRNALLKLAEGCRREVIIDFKINGSTIKIPKKAAFKMLTWLCAYYEFCCKKKNHSRQLVEVFGNQQFRYIFSDEPGFILLLQSFVYPEDMIQSHEVSPELDERALRLALTASGQVVPLQRDGSRSDPLYELFNSIYGPKKDPSDVALCNAIVNMVAVVLACPQESNHLWYHLFAADSLPGTFMTGFMLGFKISDGLKYDCGVELTLDGDYARPDYITHATRGTLSLHSLYMLLFVNFGAFSIALLTQPDAHQHISGPLISVFHPIRHYCVIQLRSLWIHLINNMKLSLEELSFLMMKSMLHLMEAVVTYPRDITVGIFEAQEDLDKYEKAWNDVVFDRAYSNLRTEFKSYCRMSDSPLIQDLRCMERYYPHFPSMKELCQAMQSIDVSSPEKNIFYILSQFTLAYPRLKAGGALLPDLIYLYRWIHTELAHLIDRESAENKAALEFLAKANDEYEGFDLGKLFEKVRDCYNEYVSVVGGSIGAGACAIRRRDGKLYRLESDTKLLHLLTVSEGEDGFLFLVIEDIIQAHNEFLATVFKAVELPIHTHLRHFLPDRMEDYIYPDEVNGHACILGKIESAFPHESVYGADETLQIIRSHYCQCVLPDSSPNDTKDEFAFDFDRVQNDVILSCVAGKPMIYSPSEHLRVVFPFKKHISDPILLDLADTDLSALTESIPSGFQKSLEADEVKEIECEFHTANHHILREVANGLKIVVEFLVKAHDRGVIDSGDVNITLYKFLMLIYKTEESGIEVLNKVGISSATELQCECLLKLKLGNLHSILENFVQWRRDGMFDFCELPLTMKKHLEHEDEESIAAIHDVYSGICTELSQDIQSLSEALVHSEDHLRQTIATNLKKPILDFLVELKMCGEEEKNLTDLIPRTILGQHYVALRVALRRLRKSVLSELSAQSQGIVNDKKRWNEFVEDLWSKSRLKHIQDLAAECDFDMTEEFVYDPSTGLFGFQPQPGFEDYNDQLNFDDDTTTDDDRKSPNIAEVVPDLSDRSPPVPCPLVNPAPVPSLSEDDLANRLTVEDVGDYLRSLKLDQYVELFASNLVTGRLLFVLNRQDLADLGVGNSFHRISILNTFKPYLATYSSSH